MKSIDPILGNFLFIRGSKFVASMRPAQHDSIRDEVFKASAFLLKHYQLNNKSYISTSKSK